MDNMVRNEEKFGKDLGLVHEAIVTGRSVGADKRFWARLAHSEALFASCVSFMTDYPLSPSQEVASEVFGSRFFGPNQVKDALAIEFSQSQLVKLAEIPFTKEEMVALARERQVLVAGYPASLRFLDKNVRGGVGLKGTSTAMFGFNFEDYSWDHRGEPFTKEKVQLGWYVMDGSTHRSSRNMTWRQQLSWLRKNDGDAPTVVEAVYVSLVCGARVAGIDTRCDSPTNARRAPIVRFHDRYAQIITTFKSTERELDLGVVRVIRPASK